MKNTIVILVTLIATIYGCGNREPRNSDNRVVDTVSATTANKQADISKTELEHIKGITAYYANAYVFGDDQNKPTLTDSTTRSEIYQWFEKSDKNKPLLDAIFKSEPTSKVKDSVIVFYSEKIFEAQEFKDWSQQGDIDKIGEKIRDEICIYLDSKAKNKTKKATNTTNVSTFNTKTVGDEAQGVSIVPILSLAMAILSLCGCVLLYIMFKRYKNTLDKNIKEDIQGQDELITEVQEKMDEHNKSISSLEHKINQIDNSVKHIEKTAARSNSTEKRPSTQMTNTTSTQSETKKAPSVLYTGKPYEGIFYNDSLNLQPNNETFYKIVVTGESCAEFEFENTASNLTVLRISTDQITNACIIMDRQTGFSKVVTKKKGTLQRTPDGWKINRLAEVELV